jgi:glutamine amidotransferase
MAGVIADVTSVTGGRFNLLGTDGEQIVATRWGDTLYLGPGPDGVLVASEPGSAGNEGGWQPVPDRSLVVVDRDGPRIQPLCTPVVEGARR